MGITLEPQHTEPESISIWPEHTEAWEVFLACARQWRIVSGMAGAFYQGLDAAALAATMDMMGVEDKRARLRQVSQIESGALELLNQR